MRDLENFTIISVLVWHNHHHMILIFISLLIPKQAFITSVLKITLKNWNRHGRICINPDMATADTYHDCDL